MFELKGLLLFIIRWDLELRMTKLWFLLLAGSVTTVDTAVSCELCLGMLFSELLVSL